jgi:hypothetical protein
VVAANVDRCCLKDERGEEERRKEKERRKAVKAERREGMVLKRVRALFWQAGLLSDAKLVVKRPLTNAR